MATPTLPVTVLLQQRSPGALGTQDPWYDYYEWETCRTKEGAWTRRFFLMRPANDVWAPPAGIVERQPVHLPGIDAWLGGWR